MKFLLLVGFLGGVGSLLRYGVNSVIVSNYFPFSTLLVNCIGSFLIGVLFSLKTGWISNTELKLALAAGLLGGLTTFSGYSWDLLGLLQKGQPIKALSYLVASNVFAFLFCWIGYSLVKRIYI